VRKLILIEGIPGSGKSTLSRKIAEYMSAARKTHLYEEGEGHPADLAWCACIPVEQLDSIMKKYPDYESRMREYMYIEDGYAVVPYIQFPIEDRSFIQLMESFEVYDNRVGFETFTQLHMKKWKRFGEQASKAEDLTVFECAFLQNHINELLLFHCMSEEQVEKYLLKLITTVKDLEPVLIYLNQPSVYETLRKVSEVRLNEEGKKVWVERVIPYIENSPYGRLHSLNGFNGMVEYFEHRKRVEMNIIAKLPIETFIIDNPDYDWAKIWEDIKEILLRL
jgi:hypothetical protein